MFYTRQMRVAYREEPCKTALNRVKGMPFDWSLNPYMGCVHRCTFCYVRAFELRADRPSDDRYGSSIRVKTNIAEVLRRQLARASWAREPIAIGAATDPYQPAEGRYRLTRACLQVLRDASQAFSIITRGPLIVRDAELLAEASRRADVSVTFSVPTLDPDVWRSTEPGTAPPAQRLRALGVLVEHGVRVSVGMAPLLPGISDGPDQIRRVVEAARAAGACGIWANLLYLKPGTKEHFMECLARDWPELVADYERLYERRAYLATADTEQTRAAVRGLARAYGIRDRRPEPLRPPPSPEQLSLLSSA
jgi:DNA repair photolyase